MAEVKQTPLHDQHIALGARMSPFGGYLMPVHEVFIKYKNPAHYDELLEVETRIEKIPELIVHLDHTVRSADRGIIICEGYIELVFIKKESKKICRPPEFFMKVISPFFTQPNK